MKIEHGDWCAAVMGSGARIEAVFLAWVTREGIHGADLAKVIVIQEQHPLRGHFLARARIEALDGAEIT